jgi:excinuclease ABC subunit C
MELQKQYKKNISRVILVLSGKFDGVRKDLQKEMHTLSDEENFEKAKLIREQIAGLDYITSPQIPTDFYVENPNLYEDIRKKELAELKSLLKRGHLVINKLNRIECYDIAHLSGTNATASMVTFTNGEADKNYYRHFKIRQEKGGSDTDSLKEVAKRRFKHLQDWGVPDLMIVDGGEGQVNAFKKEIRNIPIVGVAKHPDRLIVMDIKMKLESLSLNLVSRMRDEAHRFARRYHHNLISKIYKNEIAV